MGGYESTKTPVDIIIVMPRSASSSFQPTPRPAFPEPGGTIGPNGKYFSLCKLGHGTFCAISKCINLAYHHDQQPAHVHMGSSTDETASSSSNKQQSNLRLVAAKVELSNFENSGMLDGEAAILAHLSRNMPSQMVPKFMDYIKAPQIDPRKKGLDWRDGGGSSGMNNNSSAKEISAIIMEYLAGCDMHQLRDRHAQLMAKRKGGTSADLQAHRRLCVEDSVYLCRNILLPLLQSMHDCGVIHRDVKPSNAVRTGAGKLDRDFKLVDFGLSKSFVVPRDSSYANNNLSWDGPWDDANASSGGSGGGGINSGSMQGCIRKERNGAEFRGTSMYASLRVHQLKDYCRRDDMWGLMYVFLDLVSGGLPWMGYAAIRDRQMCQRIKEWVHGEREEVNDDNEKNDASSARIICQKVCSDRVEEFLKGSEYHLSKYKRDVALHKANKQQGDSNENSSSVGTIEEADLPPLPAALDMMHDKRKIKALRDAFDHLATLEFADRPNYDLIGKCLDCFLTDEDNNIQNRGISTEKGLIGQNIPSIHWKQPTAKEMDKRKWERMGKVKKENKIGLCRPSLLFLDDLDPLSEGTLTDAENMLELAAAQAEDAGNASHHDGMATSNNSNSAEVNDVTRLPLELQFRLAQVEYNAANPDTIPIHLAFRDWIELASSLVYDTWDSSKYERGNHRLNDDGYRRELYLRLVHQCIEAAKPFGNFCSRDCFYFEGNNDDQIDHHASRKRRRISVDENKIIDKSNSSAMSSMLAFSKVSCALRALLDREREKIFAPPPALSFGAGFT
mmetsp:Transcript_4909/g.7199  ORF Transcript_4909/g.7199 Transcript_4909/m.7199 type:complete len:788 (+) Transcript_4909:22-2385(+)